MKGTLFTALAIGQYSRHDSKVEPQHLIRLSSLLLRHQAAHEINADLYPRSRYHRFSLNIIVRYHYCRLDRDSSSPRSSLSIAFLWALPFARSSNLRLRPRESQVSGVRYLVSAAPTSITITNLGPISSSPGKQE